MQNFQIKASGPKADRHVIRVTAYVLEDMGSFKAHSKY